MRSRKVPIHGQLDLMMKEVDTPYLPDKIPTPVHTLFVGYGPGKESAASGHYYAGSSNYMWKLIFRSGIWPEMLSSEDDDRLVRAGFGFTDMIKRPTDGTIIATRAEKIQARHRLTSVAAKHHPDLIVLVGLEAIRIYLRRPNATFNYGIQNIKIEGIPVYLVPSTSGASVGSTSWSEKLNAFDKLKVTMEELGIPRQPIKSA